MKREIIRIDEDRCDGCGLCVSACAEGALAIIDGKAKLISEIYCDGLGACLSDCPQDAIKIEKREAAAFDEEAVKEHLSKSGNAGHVELSHSGSCPGTAMRDLSAMTAMSGEDTERMPLRSQLSHWPVQLKLIPAGAPFLEGADLVLSADCVPFALPGFHSEYLKGNAVATGCPKLDDNTEQVEKLARIFSESGISSITVTRMEVPCCGGLASAATKALEISGKSIPIEIHTISIGGDIKDISKN